MKAILKKNEANKEPFSFVFVEGEETILKSEHYKAKANAVNGLNSVKKNAEVEKRYELKESKNGKFFFNLKATNGQIIGTSKMFATLEAREVAIKNLQTNAKECEVENSL